MISLDLPQEPYWVDLPYGVRVKVRPLDTAIDAAVSARTAAILRNHGEYQAADDEALRIGHTKQVLASSLGALTILEWTGVLAVNKLPASVTPATTAQLMAIPAIASRFLAELYAPLDRLAAEGNASSAAPNGTTAAAPVTAAAAAPGAVPDAATDART